MAIIGTVPDVEVGSHFPNRQALHDADMHRGLMRGIAPAGYSIVLSGGFVDDEASITGMMLDWLKLSKESDVWPQRDVIKYIRCSVVMDGLIKRLDPDFDVGAALAKAAHAHLEAGLRRNVFSYERVFEVLYNSGELLTAGPTALITAVSNVAKALELPPGI
jgi:hypothetical protein